jgi:membrane protease YdiL (CAAX protease family)
MLAKIATSGLANLILLAGIPFLLYWGWHRWRHRRALAEVARRAGLRLGPPRYLAYAALAALLNIAVLLAWSPPISSFTSHDSPQRVFEGLGLSGTSLLMALIYGVVTTGFCEEFLFRGLLAGSLSRRLPAWLANGLQAFLFLLPHLLVLRVRPELWPLLPVVFVAALFLGWLRIRSGSIMGPWLFHAAINVATCLYVALGSSA